MIRLFLFLILLPFSSLKLYAQVNEDSSALITADTIKPIAIPHRPAAKQTIKDTVPELADTLAIVKPVLDSSWKKIIRFFAAKSFREFALSHHPFFAFDAVPVIADSDIKRFNGKELLFYSLIGLLLIFAELLIISCQAGESAFHQALKSYESYTTKTFGLAAINASAVTFFIGV